MRTLRFLLGMLVIAGCSSSTSTPAPDAGTRTDAGTGDAASDVDGGATDDASTTDGGGTGGDAGPDLSCPSTQLRCGGACVDVSADTSNCGACGALCAKGELCVAGECGGTSTCPAGTVSCGPDCRDVSADPEFCGSCAPAPCADDQVCADGLCSCRPGLSVCGGACVDFRSDPAHCGGCDSPCSGICTAGVCGSTTACTDTLCGAACVDTATNPAHCGACGDACAVDQVCIDSTCEDYEPAAGCTTCGGCDACPADAFCCALAGYGASCLDTGVSCP